MRIGISGSHRVGKTTLCQELAKIDSDYKFHTTSTSKIYVEMGLTVSEELDTAGRIDFQERALARLQQSINNAESSGGDHWIMDRTPIDLIAYTTISCDSRCRPPLDWFDDYAKRCLSLMDCYDILFLLQPGIEIADPQGKGTASLDPAFIWHFNRIFRSFFTDRAFMGDMPNTIIPGHVRSLVDRLLFIKDAIR